MKYITLLVSASVLFFACGEEGEASVEKVDLAAVVATTGGPEIVFEEAVFDFGQVKTGDSVVHQYVFKNTGDQPLIIAQANASCGCTVPNKPKDPILPGEKGAITAKIAKAGKAQSNKEVTITVDSNAKSGKKTLKLTGDIVEK
jgi:hypothetical protein